MVRGAVFLLACLATPALAVEIDIGGNFGDEAGCRHLSPGGYVGEEYIALTPKEVGTYATLCTYVTATTLENGTIVTTVLCGHEGTDEQTMGFMRFTRTQDGSKWAIHDQNGTLWGEVPPCP